jgi:hypothetical protein
MSQVPATGEARPADAVDEFFLTHSGVSKKTFNARAFGTGSANRSA